MSLKKFALTVSFLALVVPASAAMAQTQIKIKNDGMLDDADAVVGTGYMVGSFMVAPTLLVTEEYDDNIYTEDSNDVSDFITHIAPEVTAQLQGNEMHDLTLKAGLDQALFADETQNHYLNWDASARHRVKFDQTMSLLSNLGYRKRHSLPGDDDADPSGDAGEPLPFNIFDANTKLTKEFGQLKVEPRLGWRGLDYDNVRELDGTLIDQGDRDRDEYKVGGRVGYDMGNSYELFTDLEFQPIKYDRSSATDHDSDGGSYLAGFAYRPGKNMLAEIAAGYMNRDYDTAAFEDIDELDVAARLNWAFTETMLMRASYNRSIVEVSGTDTGGAVRDDVKASITTELAPAWTAGLNARYTNTDYKGGLNATSGTEDREDDFVELGAGAAYSLTDNVAFTADYSYGTNDSNSETSEYDQNVIMLGVKAGF